MRVTLVSTEGLWLEAFIATPYGELCVMDKFTNEERDSPKMVDEFEVELSASLIDDETWEYMFAGNPDKRKALDPIRGWSYRAYGEVISINPSVVDCGMMLIPDVISSNDARLIGEFIAFTISRLEASGAC